MILIRMRPPSQLATTIMTQILNYVNTFFQLFLARFLLGKNRANTQGKITLDTFCRFALKCSKSPGATMFKKIHVYDCDGVLVDSSHRYRNDASGKIDLAYWKANTHRAADDSLLPHARQYVDDVLNPFVYTVVCTARETDTFTPRFFADNMAMPNLLIMRPAGNETQDWKLKRQQLTRLFNLRQFAGLPRILWEDNANNIDALRHLFTNIFHVRSKIA
jgi:hypothetical protein